MAEDVDNDHIPTIDSLSTRLAQEERHVTLDSDQCTNVRCKYCTGGLVTQREHLLSRLIGIERVLFKDGLR